jgi:hypothetical protein
MKKITTLLFALVLLSATYAFANKTNDSKNLTVIVTDSLDLSEYVGKFKFAEGSPVEFTTISFKGGKLYTQAGEYPEMELTLKVKDQFTEATMGLVVTFTRTDNKIDKLKVEVQGMELLATKVEEGK